MKKRTFERKKLYFYEDNCEDRVRAIKHRLYFLQQFVNVRLHILSILQMDALC